MVTLEELMDRCGIEAVDLLKLDCEGAEWDILPAAEGVLPRVRQICMEFHCERGWTAAKLAPGFARKGSVSRTPAARGTVCSGPRGRNVDCRVPD